MQNATYANAYNAADVVSGDDANNWWVVPAILTGMGLWTTALFLMTA
jgi:hypothetical protein